MDPVFTHLPLPTVLAWCGAPATEAIIPLLFLTGLVGGVAHCGPMCGPFVLAQTADAPAATVLVRLTGNLLLPYHLGRTLTYTMLGAVGAGMGGRIIAVGPMQLPAALLLAFAALAFLGQGMERLAPGIFPVKFEVLPARLAPRVARVSRRLLQHRLAANRFALGLVLGLLPCGFLYTALAAAAATGGAAAGALAMASFGFGTVPSLILVGIAGAAAAGRWRGLARRLTAPLFLFNGTVLMVMAFSVLAPD